MSSEPMVVDGVTCIRMISFQLQKHRVSMYRLIDASSPYAVTSTRGGKSILCISKEHADTIYDWCCDHLSMEFMGARA